MKAVILSEAKNPRSCSFKELRRSFLRFAQDRPDQIGAPQDDSHEGFFAAPLAQFLYTARSPSSSSMRSRRLYFASRSERVIGSDLDLPGACGNGQVRHRIVLGFAGARADHRAISVPFRECDHFQGFRERADLIHFNQHGIGGSGFDPLLQPGGIGGEEIVADQLHAWTKPLGQEASIRPSRLRQVHLQRR